ncbi:hypothetical protein AKUA1202_05290 [Apilactobacillus kunkeei]|uniref:hypothetical protein n=1 Tax=Apilactobacillus TaxID=2767877 RepID=UPI00112C29F0|nr:MULTISPECIES: hypothetical protein [Apilactobacillus]MCT6858084.1 hypothetical protein [Apilactobacillus sp.]MCK8619641.1 hypothetical protein [Apilactobacillus kunkeei]MCX0325162.1 hypothetical protein [Apilactobacillus kunkeei]MDN2613484.1 hypothetical protein [Apilactobacillus sp. EABW-1NA]CAI2583543.1 hypothetical protein AKUA1802_05180 [Apilactobacillus kunkeei]
MQRKLTTGSWIKLKRFLQISLKTLSERAVKFYINNDSNANIMWNAFINGATTIDAEKISNMNAPELSVFVYAMKKRIESQRNLYSGMLGGV